MITKCIVYSNCLKYFKVHKNKMNTISKLDFNDYYERDDEDMSISYKHVIKCGNIETYDTFIEFYEKHKNELLTKPI